MPQLMHCQCHKCGHRWRDYPGAWAKQTRPQFPDDPRQGCPECGHLYWGETPIEHTRDEA